jgi:DNA processing protein
MMTDQDIGWLRLHLTPGLGRVAMLRLMEAFGGLEQIMTAPADHWQQLAGVRKEVTRAIPATDHLAVREARMALDKAEARIIPLSDSNYPPLLKTIHDPPAILYLRGQLPPGEAMAIVGSRRSSGSGRRLTAALSQELAERGIGIVSGLARGIDTAAHQGALDGGGYTAAVLGCGIDRIYPPENARLFYHILDQGGGILSEYAPGAPPLAGHFPGRSRIISGLCRGVMVVEAAEESGSLITADFALEQGREVFAVPGPVFSENSRGVNRLLKDGARLVTETGDILSMLWPQSLNPTRRRQQDTFAERLPDKDRRVYEQLANDPLHIDELGRLSGLTPMELSAILLHLELAGGVEQLPGKHYVRSRKP